MQNKEKADFGTEMGNRAYLERSSALSCRERLHVLGVMRAGPGGSGDSRDTRDSRRDRAGRDESPTANKEQPGTPRIQPGRGWAGRTGWLAALKALGTPFCNSFSHSTPSQVGEGK